MRTKTLVLTALGSMSALGLMAQTSTNVYSLNAVGYINVVCAPGFTMIADQLWASGGNTISNVLSDSTDAIDNCNVYKWNGTTFLTDQADNQVYTSPSGWNHGGAITLNPGEALWFQNTTTNTITNTFVGTVPQGSSVPTIALGAGFTMASSAVPQTGDLVQLMGLTNFSDGDQVYVYNPGAGYTTYSVSFAGGQYGYNADWLQPSPTTGQPYTSTETNYGDPYVTVGQGFWYETAHAINYTRVFSVND